MKGAIGLILGFFFLFPAFGQKSYEVKIDLLNVVDDKATIEITVPQINESTVVYQLPSIIPGLYALYNYSNYIDELTAYSITGERLPVKKNKEGLFVIKKAKTLRKIVYTVNDTWDDSSDIFPPGGTQIEDRKVLLINHFGFIGFIKGYEDYPYSVTYLKPGNLHASTPLKINNLNDTVDVISNINFDVLADNPVFYTNPDTSSFYLDQTKINITTYSINKTITSEYLSPILKEVTQSVKKFFGELPIPEYSFYFYFAGYQESDITKDESFGALEHRTSSVYFLPEMPTGYFLRSLILGIATHEFLHITTPLNLHSNEIHHFNYSEPNLSSHLWLYEGVVEYLSLWLLYEDSLITKDELILELRQKLIQSEKYENVSFTEMSRNITKSPYNEMYNNVYNKGALIAFLLDIEINKLSDGEKNLQKILIELYKKYKTSSFDDNMIIDEIISLVDPKLRDFFDDYVVGSKPLPINEYFQSIGWSYEKVKKETLFTFGKINLTFSTELSSILIEKSNPKQNMFHFDGGELIKSINEIEVTINNFQELSNLILAPDSEGKIVLEVEKDNKFYTIEAAPLLMPAFEQHLITENPLKTKEQNTIHNWVFKNNNTLNFN